jgi:hypothetical protein
MKHFVSIIAAFIVINFAIGQAKKPATTKTVSKPETETSTPKGESRPPIPITLKPYKNTWVYLGSYYGKGKTLIDSAYVDENSKGVFKPKPCHNSKFCMSEQNSFCI